MLTRMLWKSTTPSSVVPDQLWKQEARAASAQALPCWRDSAFSAVTSYRRLYWAPVGGLAVRGCGTSFTTRQLFMSAT